MLLVCCDIVNCNKHHNVCVLYFSYPLVNLPLPGNLPLQVPGPNNDSFGGPLEAEPWCYVQQVVLRSAVIPWSQDLVLADAFRAPLYEVFKLLEVVRNFEHESRYVFLFFVNISTYK